MKSLTNAVLYGLGGLAIMAALSDAISFDIIGSLADILLTSAGCLAIAMPLFTEANEFWQARSDERAAGADHASRQAFIRAMDERDLRHERAVEIIATERGRLQGHLESATLQIEKMTTRRNDRGRFIKRDPHLTEVSITPSAVQVKTIDVSSLPRE